MKFLLFLLAAAASSFAADVTLRWDANAPEQQVSKYSVYEIGEQTTKLTEVWDPTVVLSNVTPGVHTYAVTASNFWGESDLSNPVHTPSAATPPTNTRIITISVTVQ